MREKQARIKKFGFGWRSPKFLIAELRTRELHEIELGKINTYISLSVAHDLQLRRLPPTAIFADVGVSFAVVVLKMKIMSLGTSETLVFSFFFLRVVFCISPSLFLLESL